MLSVVVTHRGATFPFDIDESSTVGNLAEAVAAITGVPAAAQKLVYKGKSLQPPDAPLEQFKLKPKAKIMLIGKKVDDEDDQNVAAIDKIRTEVEELGEKLPEVASRIDGIEKGFLPEEHVTKELKSITYRNGGVLEKLLQCLEKLDGISIPREQELTRTRRKTVIQRIEQLLAVGDAHSAKLKELTARHGSE
eukprot:m.131534 g.131534  ORF g.131534 m.131534 type:complete len:193 (+) comp9813_c0_seq6:88-666(+)